MTCVTRDWYNIPLNLFLSLPEDLMRQVFDYEKSVYRDMFKTLVFKDELTLKWWFYKESACFKRVKELFNGMHFSGIRNWENEYGRITNIELSKNWKNKPMYTSVDDFMIYLHPFERGIVKYKILPKGATKQNCEFLRNSKTPKVFDGFFVRSDEPLLWKTKYSSYDVLEKEPNTFQFGQRISFLNRYDTDLILWTWFS